MLYDHEEGLGPIIECDRKLRQARIDLDRAVVAARRDGQSWESIGRVLGVTRQAAWERYRDSVGITDSGSRSDG